MAYLNQEIDKLLTGHVDILRFVDISGLDVRQNRSLPNAILIGIGVNPQFIKMVSDHTNYIHTNEDEYAQTEKRAGVIADKLAKALIERGYKALSQSDRGLMKENAFDYYTKTSVLPHKTIAILAGLGWIGKNNLLITPEYGAAQCLGSVLTDAPLYVDCHAPNPSKCGKCTVCVNTCHKKALKGRDWNRFISRDDIINVSECNTCLRCMVNCPVTMKCMKRFTTK